jgi:hypothetical protein
MPQKPKKTGFSFQGYDVNSYKLTESYAQAIDMLYQSAVDDFSRAAIRLNIDPSKAFSFSDYPQANAQAKNIIQGLANNIQSVINNGVKAQWLYACDKNDNFIASILDTTNLKKATMAKMQDRNLDALSAFQTRKVNGLDLSQRIWNYASQMKTQMELGIDVRIGQGTSAQDLSKQLRQFLVDPDKLFRRVRDKRGNLQLSKAAKAFHPGQGKYRSSYKNAMRLTRSEVNMAYRESDQLRWRQMDFVAGFEVKLSNNHPFPDICDALKGKYPKDFKFVGWHPQCRCHAVPILMDPDEFDTDELNEMKAALYGTEYRKYQSANTVTDVPDGFKKWVALNTEKSKNWTSQPYFIRDNFKGGKLSGGLNLDAVENSNKSNIGVYDKIKSVENDIRINKKFETLVAFDMNGNEVFRKQGGSTSVSFSSEDLLNFKDNIVTHNHPKGWKYDEGSLLRIGSSFSPEDITTAISANAAEMRAVTPLYTFSIKRPKEGWMSVSDMVGYYKKMNSEVRSYFESIIRNSKNQEVDIERANVLHFHVLWKRLCDKYGIEYTKAKTM